MIGVLDCKHHPETAPPAPERLVRKSLAASCMKAAANKLLLAVDRDVCQAKSLCDNMNDVALGYKHCPDTAASTHDINLVERPPKEYLAAKLNTAASERLLRKSLVANHTATKKSLLLAEDEKEVKISRKNATMVKGACQLTQPPSKHRAEGRVIQEEYGALRSKASVEGAPFHASPPPPARIAALLILPIPSVFPSASSERGAAESHLPSLTDRLTAHAPHRLTWSHQWYFHTARKFTPVIKLS
jgi:hypothetical protein